MKMDKLRRYLDAAGRKPSDVGMEAVGVNVAKPDHGRNLLDWWRHFGATHLSVVTTSANLGTPQEHIDAIYRFKTEVGL